MDWDWLGYNRDGLGGFRLERPNSPFFISVFKPIPFNRPVPVKLQVDFEGELTEKRIGLYPKFLSKPISRGTTRKNAHPTVNVEFLYLSNKTAFLRC